MQTKVYNIAGQEVGKMTLKDDIFGREYNKALIHQVVVASLANARQGTKSTLTRSEVSGGGRKPWKQKGTGNARQGSIRAPQWIKGGIVFAPKPRDFSQKINKQMKKAAFLSAISTLFAEKNMIVLDELKIDAKTKKINEVLKNLKVDKKSLFVTAEHDENVIRAGRNIPNVNVCTASLVSTLDLVNAGTLIITKDAVKQIEEAYKE